MTGCRVNHHANRLVHHDHVIILVDNIQWYVLGNGLHRLGLGQSDLQFIADGHLVIFFDRFAAQQNRPLLQQSGCGGAGQVIYAAGQKHVHAFTCQIGGEDQHIASHLSEKKA